MSEINSFPPADRDALGQAEQILNQAAPDEGVALEAQDHIDRNVTDPDALVLRSLKQIVDNSPDRNDTPAEHPLEQANDVLRAVHVSMAAQAFNQDMVDRIKAQTQATPPAERFRNVAKFRKAPMSNNLQRHKNIAKTPKESNINLKNNPYRNQ